jgi:hypothetical protein
MDLCLAQSVENLAVEQFIAKVFSNVDPV